MNTFEPDEPILHLSVQIHTADVFDADSDSDVFIELFDWPSGFPVSVIPFRVELDTADHNDFERGDTKIYVLPAWYFEGRMVNDIQRIRLFKADDLGSDWGFGWLSVLVNSKTLFSNFNPENPENVIWLEDGETWNADWTPIPFVKPSIQTLGLPDAGPNQVYEVKFKAKSGRKPLTWEVLAGVGDAFQKAPIFKNTQSDGTGTTFSTHTIQSANNHEWAGIIQVTDAEGRIAKQALSMRLINQLPPPKLHNFSPPFGWAALSPAEPTATLIELIGENFDSTKPGATEVFFLHASHTKWVAGKILDIIHTKLIVAVPPEAGRGPLKVKTKFGEVESIGEPFTAHPNGYRFTGGFRFFNDSDDFPDSFAYERYEETFGITDMWICDPILEIPIIPNPVAHLFYLCTHGVISNGCCHGFALTSLQLRKSLLPFTTFTKKGEGPPVDNTLWDFAWASKPADGISAVIQSRQLSVFSDEALSYFLDQLDDIPNVGGNLCQMDARPALQNVKNALALGLTDPVFLAFAKNCSPVDGHVVVPYSVEKNGSFENIRCYDPNHPADKHEPSDQNSFFVVNPKNGDWSYKGKSEQWDGLYMFTIPLSTYGCQWDWMLPGAGTLFGSLGLLAGMASAVGGEIVQVEDIRGQRLFDTNGNWNPNKAQWPEAARPVPMFEEAASPKWVALRRSDAFLFTIRPHRTLGSDRVPALFSILQGGDFSFSVEEITHQLQVRFDLGLREASVLSPADQAPIVIRYTHRFRTEAESLAFAVRCHTEANNQPIILRHSEDRRGLSISTNERKIMVDIEVTHTNRAGEIRILEHDDLVIAAHAGVTFRVENFEALGLPGETPLVFDLEQGGQVSRQHLGERITKPQIVTPGRILTLLPNEKNNLPAVEKLVIDVSKSRVVGSHPRFLTRYGPGIERQERGQLHLSVPRGSRVLQIVAESEGQRSFPRHVFITAAGEGEPVIPVLCVVPQPEIFAPGTTGQIPLKVFLDQFPTQKINLAFSVRRRISGSGKRFPSVLKRFIASPELRALGATVKATLGRNATNLHLEIEWKMGQPQTGWLTLGSLSVQIPAGIEFGHTFVLSGDGFAYSQLKQEARRQPIRVLASPIRIWGGEQPTSLQIDGPEEVREFEEIFLLGRAEGVSPGTANAGWWTNSVTGSAKVKQLSPGGFAVQLEGRRAGIVKVSVVVGDRVSEKFVRVVPNLLHPLRRLLTHHHIRRRGRMNFHNK